MTATPASTAPGTSPVRQVGRDALIYGLQPVLSRLVSFVMLPVYTRYLTPADYGVLQLLETTADITAIVFTAGAVSGTQRFYFKTEDEERRRVLLSTNFLALAGLSFLGALTLQLLAPWIHGSFLRGEGNVLQVRIAALNVWTMMLGTVPMISLQVRRRPALVTSIGVGRLVLQLSLNILFVVGVQWGVTGVLTSTLVTNCLVGGGLALWLLRSTGFHFNRAVRHDLRRFGRPMRLASFGSYILNFGDRYFLQTFIGAAAVGIYGLAYQFGFVFSSFCAGPFLRAWGPHRMQLAMQPEEVRNPIFDRVFFVQSLVLLVGYTGVSVLVRPALHLLTTPGFFSAAALVPVIVPAYVAQAWTETFKFQIDVAEETRYYNYATWIAVVVILALYAGLIPLFGSAGAAWATALGFGFRCVVTRRFAQRLWPVPYSWGRVRLLAALSILAAVGAAVLPSLSIGYLAGVTGAILLAYFATVWLVVLDRDERGSVLEFLRPVWPWHRGAASAQGGGTELAAGESEL